MPSGRCSIAGLVLLPCSVAFSVLQACGGEGGRSTQASSDGGSTDVEAGTVIPDEGSPEEAGPLDAGSATMTGPQGFPVRWAWMDPSEPAAECRANTVPGGFAATAIDLFEQDVSSLACTDGGLASGGGRIVDIEIATSQYAANRTLTQPLAAGPYVIGNEGENDEDLCMLPSGYTAILQVFELEDASNGAQWIATSGAVTIDSVSPTSIVGSFDVVLGGAYGQTDAAAPPELTGRFNAVTCP